MDETIGDNDGTMGGKRYFQTHDGQGMFIREESGRAEAVQKANSSVSKEMLEHLRFLFDSFDSDESGGIQRFQRDLHQQGDLCVYTDSVWCRSRPGRG